MHIDFNVDARIYGSCATGLSLPYSDVDIGIIGFENEPRCEIIKILNNLASILENFKWVKSVEKIFTATIPIIKIVKKNILKI
jgi:DNA polymerase sigma